MGMQEDLLRSMQTIAEASVEDASFDKTRKCQVVGMGANNTYTIRLDGVTYPDITVYGDCTLQIGDIVRVGIPCNEPSQMYIIPPGSLRGIQADWNATEGLSQILNKPNLAEVATSGDYNDLINRLNFEVLIYTISSRSWGVGGTWLTNAGLKPTIPEGYEVLGVIGYSPTNYSQIIPVLTWNADAKEVRGFVRNVSSSAITDSIRVRLLLMNKSVTDSDIGGGSNPDSGGSEGTIQGSGVLITRKTYDEWSSVEEEYIPINGEFCVYTTMINSNGIPVLQEGLKIGDGETLLKDIPFVGAGIGTIDKLNHKLTIGDAVFDGSEDVTIRIYGGDYE